MTDYYSSYTRGEKLHTLAAALEMLPTTKIAEIAKYHIIPRKVIAHFAKEQGLAECIPDGNKPDFFPQETYNKMEIHLLEGETKEEINEQIKIERCQSKCEHKLMICRCSICMKVLGGEIQFILKEKVLSHIFVTVDDMLKTHDQSTVRDMGTRLTNLFINE